MRSRIEAFARDAFARSILFAKNDESSLVFLHSSFPDFVVGRISDLPNSHVFEADSLPHPFSSIVYQMRAFKTVSNLQVTTVGTYQKAQEYLLGADAIT